MSEVKFTGISVWRAKFGLRFTFSHNLASRDEVDTLLVTVVASNGGIGYGQALPRAYLTGESIQSAVIDIRERWWPMLNAISISTAADFLEARQALLPLFEKADSLRCNASYAAVDVAALSAFAAGQGMAAQPAVASVKPLLPLVGVIPATSPSIAAWLARAMKCLKYKFFKIKVGANAVVDIARVAAVRAVVGESAWLALDANAAWWPEQAESQMRQFAKMGVKLIEEPLNPEDARSCSLGELERRTGMAVMADESLCTLADAHRLLENDGPSWWNLRLAKNGGFTGLAQLSDLAQANKINVYGGILVGETSALTAAGKAAVFSANAFCSEYGFPRIFIKGDPFRGGPGGFSGVYTQLPASTKGLGITVDAKQLRKVAGLLWHSGEGVGERIAISQ